MECLLPYLRMVTVPHIMVGLERMLDYRGFGLERFHCMSVPVHWMVERQNSQGEARWGPVAGCRSGIEKDGIRETF